MAKYFYDTHVHTDESSACGKVPGRQAARLYKAAGYQGIVITDHYTRKLPQLRQQDLGRKARLFCAGTGGPPGRKRSASRSF